MEKTISVLRKLYGEDLTLEEILQKKIDVDDGDSQNSFFEILTDVYNNRMPFNRYLGINVESLTMSQTVVTIGMTDDLIGNYEQKILHGGVISSVLDLAGGIIAQVNALKQMNQFTIAEVITGFSKMSTINMRTDYLRPGKGENFFCKGWIVRSGNKVAVTRMEFQNDNEELIALGTGTYLVG